MRIQIASILSATLLLAWIAAGTGLLGCASAPAVDLSQGGVVDPQELAARLRCPRGTELVQGQTQGVLTAVWCEKPGSVKHGPFIEWFANHQKQSAGLYEEGHRQGTWSFFLPSGQLDSQVSYDKGVVVQGSPRPQ